MSQEPRYKPCPNCFKQPSEDTKRIKNIWWGEQLPALLFTFVKCHHCDTIYNGHSGKHAARYTFITYSVIIVPFLIFIIALIVTLNAYIIQFQEASREAALIENLKASFAAGDCDSIQSATVNYPALRSKYSEMAAFEKFCNEFSDAAAFDSRNQYLEALQRYQALLSNNINASFSKEVQAGLEDLNERIAASQGEETDRLVKFLASQICTDKTTVIPSYLGRDEKQGLVISNLFVDLGEFQAVHPSEAQYVLCIEGSMRVVGSCSYTNGETRPLNQTIWSVKMIRLKDKSMTEESVLEGPTPTRESCPETISTGGVSLQILPGQNSSFPIEGDVFREWLRKVIP